MLKLGRLALDASSRTAGALIDQVSRSHISGAKKRLLAETSVQQSAGFTILPVSISGARSYDILVGTGILRELPKRIISLGLSKDIFLISSPTIFGLYGKQLTQVLEEGGCCCVVTELFPDGEQYKTVETWMTLIKRLHETEEATGKKALVLNLGGGVVGDVGGFVAACYDRGRDYIQLPTTLLGDVDCGIGGKTAVNLEHGKNLIGQFYQPRLVLADLSFLASLPARELRSGLAEVIKYGVIMDPELFDFLETNALRVLDCDMSVVEHVVIKSFKHKISVVEKDERDTEGIRATLNFGHTVGHALEAATAYKRYAHGEAIAVGMLCACDLAVNLGMFDRPSADRIENLCRRVGLPTSIADADIDSIMQYMQRDKKFIAGVNRFVLPTAIGKVELRSAIPDPLIRQVVQERMRQN